MKDGLAVGQKWTLLAGDDGQGIIKSLSTTLVITGETSKGRIRVLRVERTKFYLDDEDNVKVEPTILRPETILKNFKRNDLKFLIEHGGPVAFMRQCARDVVKEKKRDIEMHESGIRRANHQIDQLERTMKSILGW